MGRPPTKKRPPAPPVIASFAPDVGGVDNTSTIILSGTSEVSTVVTVYDGGVNIGTTSADSLRSWQFAEINASSGVHIFTATAAGVSGTSGLSQPFSVTVTLPPPPPPPAAASLTATDGVTVLTAIDGMTELYQ